MNGFALLGRDRELAELAAALARVPSASGALFLLAGEPGIGKSRLVLGVELARADVVRMLPGVTPVLDEATNSGVLVAQGARLRFSHALYREALYFDLPAARRQSIHRDAARALALAGAPAAELAHHLLEAGSAAVVEAVEQAIRTAAQAVETFAFEDALAILERARAVIPPGA